MPWLSGCLITGGIISTFSVVFVAAYLGIRNRKEAIGADRNMPDREILARLLVYARPCWKQFLLVLLIMLLSISCDILSPLIIGEIVEMFREEFPLSRLYGMVAAYVGILAVSLVCSYVQAILLQRTGQKILSRLREDTFTHIESLSHAQLHQLPVGRLVTRVCNDTNAISLMFTDILVTMARNILLVVGVLAAMLLLNCMLTLMVLCFIPFLVLFTVIFRMFPRRVFRQVKDATTSLNTFLSENLSGIRIIQIFNREQEKLEDFLVCSGRVQEAKQRQIFVFGIFRPMVYMLYISSVMCLLYLGGPGRHPGHPLSGAGDHQLRAGVLLSVHLQVLQPDSDPRRAVQSAPVCLCLSGEGHHGAGLCAGPDRCAGCHRPAGDPGGDRI